MSRNKRLFGRHKRLSFSRRGSTNHYEAPRSLKGVAPHHVVDNGCQQALVRVPQWAHKASPKKGPKWQPHPPSRRARPWRASARKCCPKQALVLEHQKVHSFIHRGAHGYCHLQAMGRPPRQARRCTTRHRSAKQALVQGDILCYVCGRLSVDVVRQEIR